ncbi:MAG: hypothetical protein HC930_01540 [Hydrococcus sp. SU_1_0]|nr:hypothetical protein [Hydrococcus sp. SU_1_0]
MADLRVRNLPEWVVSFYKESSQEHGSTLEGFMRKKLIADVLSQQAAFADEVRQGLAEVAAKYGTLPDSTDLIREIRDES